MEMERHHECMLRLEVWEMRNVFFFCFWTNSIVAENEMNNVEIKWKKQKNKHNHKTHTYIHTGAEESWTPQHSPSEES